MNARFSDEELMAFADGEADALLADKIAIAARSDAKLAARIAMFKDTALLAKSAFQELDQWQPPRELVEKIRNTTALDDKVVAFRPRPGNGNRPSVFLPSALAASIALAAGIGIGALVSNQTGNHATTSIALGPIADSEVVASLVALKSGEERVLKAGRIQFIATFTDASNRLCREFELETSPQQSVVTVSCQSDKRWEVVFTAAAPSAPNGYAPAGSRNAVDAYLQSIGASEVMSLEQEAERLKP